MRDRKKREIDSGDRDGCNGISDNNKERWGRGKSEGDETRDTGATA